MKTLLLSFLLLACVFLSGQAFAGNYDIYGTLRTQEQYIDDSQQAYEQQLYEYEEACRLNEINQRLIQLQTQARLKQQLELQKLLLELEDQ